MSDGIVQWNGGRRRCRDVRLILTQFQGKDRSYSTAGTSVVSSEKRCAWALLEIGRLAYNK